MSFHIEFLCHSWYILENSEESKQVFENLPITHLDLSDFLLKLIIITYLSRKFGNILVHASLQHVTKEVQAVVGTRCSWLYGGS